MGCCISTESTIHEVVFDEGGIARRVPKGQGTHLIHVRQDQETDIEKKTRLSGMMEYNKINPPTTLSKPETAYHPNPPPCTRKAKITKTSANSKRVQPLRWTEKN